MSEFIRSCLAICNLCICLRSMRFIIFLRPSSFSTVILWHCNFVCDPSHVSELFVRLLIAAVILVVGEFNVSSRVVLLLWNILLDMLYLVLWLFWVCTVPSWWSSHIWFFTEVLALQWFTWLSFWSSFFFHESGICASELCYKYGLLLIPCCAVSSSSFCSHGYYSLGAWRAPGPVLFLLFSSASKWCRSCDRD